MKILIGGVRGGSPVADAAFLRYGGDTTALLVEAEDGGRIIVDGGTGLRQIGERLRGADRSRPLHMLFTHFHHDHISGLPSFMLMYEPDWNMTFASRMLGGCTIEDIMKILVAPPFWPLRHDQFNPAKQFRVLEDERIDSPETIGSLEVRWCPAHHPGGSTAFRFDEPATGASVVMATDIEWSESTEAEQDAFRRLCTTPGAPGLMLFDGICARRDYEPYRGWGHSTWEEGIELAKECGAGRLLITHHQTENDDATLDRMREEIRSAWPNADLARQGEEESIQ